MKRKYMMVCGYGCLVFAFANVLAGKMLFGYLCGLSAWLMGLFLLYIYNSFSVQLSQLVVRIPFVYGCYMLMQMPYEVAHALAVVSGMAVVYSLMMTMLQSELRASEHKYVSKYLVYGGSVLLVVWLVALFMNILNFDWLLVGNDWVSVWDALEMQLMSLGILVGSFYFQAVCIWYFQNRKFLVTFPF